MAVIPIGNSIYEVDANMREASQRGEGHGMATPMTYFWFYKQVRNHGKWDYKQESSSYQNFGNFNFGATGIAAGIPEEMLHRGAGCAQQRAGTSLPEWNNCFGDFPYGDDPHDQFWIKQGIDYAKKHGY